MVRSDGGEMADLPTGTLAVTLPDQDMLIISRLQTLRQLKLSCPKYNDDMATCLDVAPLSKLSRLEQLTVEGFIPRNQGSGGLAVQLPASLTFMCCASAAPADLYILEGWASSILAATTLRKLQLVDGDLAVELKDISCLQSLTAIICSYSSVEDVHYVCYHPLPVSITSLSKLEVLRIEDKDPCYPWRQNYWIADSLIEVSAHCPNLCEMGPVADDGVRPTTEAVMRGAMMQQLTYSSCHAVRSNELLGCIPAVPLANLQYLHVSDEAVSRDLVQCICGATQLTQLRLDTAHMSAIGRAVPMAWSGLNPIGRALPKLQRLELANPYEMTASAPYFRVVMPELSAFTQIKQLQLVVGMDAKQPCPEQPSTLELLQGLSQLTQLEHLELLGYSTLTPALVGMLVAQLPKLRVLEVGRCKHPQLVIEGEAAEGAGEFAEVLKMCQCVKPQLLTVNFAQQWRGR
jgi:hypothetical protein